MSETGELSEPILSPQVAISTAARFAVFEMAADGNVHLATIPFSGTKSGMRKLRGRLNRRQRRFARYLSASPKGGEPYPTPRHASK